MSVVPDPQYALTASGNLRRRQVVSRTVEGVTVVAAVLAVSVLGILIYYVCKQGLSVMNWSFLTGTIPDPGAATGGIGPALVGSAMAVTIGTLIALPVGVLTALYLTQFASHRIAPGVRLALDLMAGLPTIIIGVFAAVLIANRFGQSIIAAGVALAIVEVPLIARASLETISRVPLTLIEAADALGVARWRTIVGVILPASSNGIVTATILAIARAAGETAPLLFVVYLYSPGYAVNPRHSIATMPLVILELFESGQPVSVQKAWGAAFVLMLLILLTNVGARVWLRRSNRKRGL